MSELADHEVTELLEAWNLGEEAALAKLVPLVYKELRRLAHSYMLRERRDHTLDTTALINEAYLRLPHAQRVQWQDRNHFLAITARLMRRVLVDFARARKAEKRGGDAERIPVTDDLMGREGRSVDLVSLDHILRDLSNIDERKSRVVELRFFGGLGVRQTAAVLGISPATVMRDWDFAKAWILRKMASS